MLIDIVILPPEKIRNLVGLKIRKATKGLGYYYIVDNTELIPHLSLFHLRIKKRNIFDLEKTLKKILSGLSPFKVRSSKVYISRRNNKGIGIGFALTKILTELNTKVVGLCNKHRDGDLFNWKKTGGLTLLDKKYIRKYGTRWSVEENFKPHLTLGRMRSQKSVLKAVFKFGQPKIDFIANTIAICTINHNGQVIKIIKTFKFNG
jgi:2'-5' RNA ligase